jgi:hypothetical protein
VAGLNQTVCALRFFYGVTLGYDEIPERIAYARNPRGLPEVLGADELGADEVVRFLEADNVKNLSQILDGGSRSG